ncbi:hypothetical protein GALMADRAFT_225700 [Galerina marginata CBS 339.88]|uniref:ZIP zinc/iron transport family n=1 Tax=Galerina marginata (strain CBS 339.88) TaxID=685588 RepID=A0A067TCX3_GALM3|nr:hypothetical protein GALMADRAFT_225700 [Galerina marginata CBS 339.88]
MSDDTLNCGNGGGADTFKGLRIASVFIIALGSFMGALFPVLAARSKWLHVPPAVFDFAKYFGSGVIIATAFIHLLSPALDELSSPCLDPSWLIYPYPLALCMLSIFSIFIVELIAFRWGTAKLKALGVGYDSHGHGSSHAAHGPEGKDNGETKETTSQDIESATEEEEQSAADAIAQMLGVAILEFGVLLHSVLIGLTLAVDPDFKVLFVVIVFHQAFEGLGVGSRLASLKLPPKYRWWQILGGCLYGITTPIGIAVGLGVKSTYNPGSTKASIVSGVLDSLSSGILLYTGLVELLAHEFLFNKEVINWSNGKLAYALGCMLAGTGIMALLGRWA